MNKDLARFHHMLKSTDAIFLFAKGKRRASLNEDRLFQSAVIREFEIIGEAANQITDKTKKNYFLICLGKSSLA